MSETHPTQYHAQALIEELRYWVPAIKDVAEILEVDEPEGWRLFVIPQVVGACSAEVLLRSDGLFDLDVGGVTYPGLALTSRDLPIRVLKGVTDGRVHHRDWQLRATGVPQWRQTYVRIDEAGSPWVLGKKPDGFEPGEEVIYSDRHFLPYRR